MLTFLKRHSGWSMIVAGACLLAIWRVWISLFTPASITWIGSPVILLWIKRHGAWLAVGVTYMTLLAGSTLLVLGAWELARPRKASQADRLR